MVFSTKSVQLLAQMRIDSSKYSSDLLREFGDDAVIFNSLLEEFDSSEKVNGGDRFVGFWENSGYSDLESKLFNYAYELYNNLDRFFTGGILELYRFKQAEWGAPEVRISKNNIASSDVDLLSEKQVIYRGLSNLEYSSKKYGQSWTLCPSIARKFAKDTYSDKPEGIVVKATVNKKDIIFYDKNNCEKEIIVKYGCIAKVTKI
jgi:hypothetical protein